jgi:hypothetical protein
MSVPPVAPQRDGARLDRAIDSIESHNQRLERLRALFPSFKKIFLVGNSVDPHERSEPEHVAPEYATQSEARESREPRHPNPLPQSERAHGRTASSPLAEGERNGVTGKRAQMPGQRLRAVATPTTVEEPLAGRQAAEAKGANGHRPGRGVTRMAYQKKTAIKPSLTLLWLFMARQTQAP